MRSAGGGANAILVRGLGIAEHRGRRLRWWPERRVVHAVRLGDGRWAGNVHAQVHSEARARADVDLAAWTLAAWAGTAPFVLGGDLNVREPATPGLIHAGGHGVDHVLVSGLRPAGTRVLERDMLSDHSPVLVELREGSMPPQRQEET